MLGPGPPATCGRRKLRRWLSSVFPRAVVGRPPESERAPLPVHSSAFILRPAQTFEHHREVFLGSVKNRGPGRPARTWWGDGMPAPAGRPRPPSRIPAPEEAEGTPNLEVGGKRRWAGDSLGSLPGWEGALLVKDGPARSWQGCVALGLLWVAGHTTSPSDVEASGKRGVCLSSPGVDAEHCGLGAALGSCSMRLLGLWSWEQGPG